MFISRIHFMCTLLCFGVTELLCQSARAQNDQLLRNIQRGSFARNNNNAQLRFISQPVTTKPTQFFQQEPVQQQFRTQNPEFDSDQIRVRNEQDAFRKSVAQANAARGFQPNQFQQELPVQQQKFFEQNANNFNVPNGQTFSQQQTFQDVAPQNQNSQQTFQRFVPQNQDRFTRPRTGGQQVSLRRPVNRPHVTSFVTTNSRRQQNVSPEGIIRSLTDQQGFNQDSQQFNQNTDFVQTEQPEFSVPRQRTPVRQRVKLLNKDIDEEAVREQAENAKYSFASEVNDRINDHNHIRAETRDGLKLSGVYSYSDGYFKRTVHYEADENGYRVVKMDSEPIGDGPQMDPSGTADIAANVGGANIQYSIRAEEVPAQFLNDRTSRSDLN